MNIDQKIFTTYHPLDKDISLLSAKEELYLIITAQAGCEDALTKLVKANDRLVFSIVHKYSTRCSYDGEVLVQEGRLGLLCAITRFDTKRGLRLSTLAVPYIKAFVSREWSKQYKKDTHEVEGLFQHTVLLNYTSYNDCNARIDQLWLKRNLVQILNTLQEPQRDIIKSYFGVDNHLSGTLQKVGAKHHLTHEGVRKALKIIYIKLARQSRVQKLHQFL